MRNWHRSKRLLLVFTVALTSSCAFDQTIVNPTRPTTVHGWRPYEAGSTTVKAEFVLNKGESTNDGHVGIQIMDVFPVKYYLLDSAELPKAKVRFFRVKDQTTICEVVFTRGGNSLTRPEFCGGQLPWDTIYIRDVNAREGWVFFDLR